MEFSDGFEALEFLSGSYSFSLYLHPAFSDALHLELERFRRSSKCLSLVVTSLGAVSQYEDQ